MNVLIDTDVDFDDYMAMLYLLLHPEVNVVGISVTGTGDAHLSHGLHNVSNMLSLTGKAADLHIPVVKGFNAPMRYSNTFPGEEREAADNHYDTPFPHQNMHRDYIDAIPFLEEYILSASEPVSLLCIGGGTTWGRFLEYAKDKPSLSKALKDKISQIIMMGGNLTSEFVEPGAEGNIQPTLSEPPCYSNKVAEWNIFVDPLGAQTIIESDLNLTLVALNATQQVPITQTFVDELNQIENNSARFLTQVLNSQSIKKGIGKYLDFWDPLAASVITNPQLIQTQSFRIRVEQTLNEENDTSGQILVDHNNGSSVNIALSADADATYCNYLNTINSDTVTK
ncbi:nucleoside hydrolase [Vibrio sp. CB1-14]|uniref:Nucleoside hydrolase n=1 Tax=Vibrio chaetopteri TaxID=3016528 RepID=A0AAU8BFU1_9VIBR